MSRSSKIFEKAIVPVQNQSGFDLSHYNLGTLNCGTLTPVLVQELMPSQKFTLGSFAEFNMPPMATNFFGRVDVKFEAFFVPYRLCLASWKKFATYANDPLRKHAKLPSLVIPNDECGAGSLADYLGYKRTDFNQAPLEGIEFPNPLPFLAYHCIYNHWYRDKHVQTPLYNDELDSDEGLPTNIMPLAHTNSFANRPCLNVSDASLLDDFQANWESIWADAQQNSSFADGVNVWELRQRNYAKDYFTTATTKPQAGDPVKVKFDVVNNSGEFSIATLRAANSLQKFCERNNLASPDYADQIQANYGVRPSDATLQYPLYLGSQKFDVYNRSVYQTAQGTVVQNNRTNNPFKTQGAEYGKSGAFGSGSLVDTFQATEQGCLMVLASVVPHSFYSSGTRRYLMNSELADFPIPMLANVGDQPIYTDELVANIGVKFDKSSVFGYTGRYSESKFHSDEVHGLLRDGETLSPFALKRGFETAQLGTQFLQIPKTALDEVQAVENVLSNFSTWYQIYFDFKVSAPLPVYCIPTLGDDKDVHNVEIDKNGVRL